MPERILAITPSAPSAHRIRLLTREELGLTVGTPTNVLVKSTEVKLAVD